MGQERFREMVEANTAFTGRLPGRCAVRRRLSPGSSGPPRCCGLRFALPNIVMMVFLSLYTIVDGMFISRYVGTLALSAVNMSYPLNSLEMALGIMLGTGGSAVIARELGEGKERQARQDFTAVVAVSLVLGILCMAAGLVFLDPLLRLLGTSDAQFQLCRTYTQVLLWFAPALFLQTVFQVLFVTAGRPGLGLGVTVAGGVANVVLDMLFMGPLGLGVAGAAVATGIGYCIPAVAGTVYFFKNRTGALWFTPFRLRWRMLLQTCGNGSSEMVSNIANVPSPRFCSTYCSSPIGGRTVWRPSPSSCTSSLCSAPCIWAFPWESLRW
ncbi:MAG: MATE family efflux transporter [Dysosmobacter sp.]